MSSDHERYAAYKDSGVEWIGEIPAGWRVERLKAGASLVNNKAVDSSLPSLGMDAIESWTGRIRAVSEQQGADDAQFNQCAAGDVLFGKLRPYLAKVAKAEFPMNCSSEFLVLRPRCYSASFLRYSLLNARLIDAVNATTYGTKMPRANWETVGNLKMPLPSISEQRAIAAYLDEKTAEIDGLIADIERSIELLQECRTSVISEAVTKGLDLNAPMKDSGIEWIGEIPVGWKTKRIKQVAKLRTGKTPPTDEGLYFDGDLPWFTPGDLQGFEALRSERNVSEVALKDGVAEVIPCGSTLLVGVGYSTGKSAIATCDCCTNQQLTALIPVAVGSRYLAYAISVLGREMLPLATFNRVPLINNAFVGNLCIPAPPLAEQRHIAAYLDEKTAAIDSLVADKRTAIDRLHEYRKSLISEAVTGAFKVPS